MSAKSMIRKAAGGLPAFVLFLFGALFGAQAQALTATASPSTCQSVNGIGSVGWSNPARAQASDNSRASATVDGTTTNWLQCSNYGFAIPTGSRIDGIVVNVERSSTRTDGGGSQDAGMRLVQAGSIGTTDRSTNTAYTTSDVVEAHGGVADLWGATWTAAQINASGFGAAFAATKPSSSGNAHSVRVDHLQIVVYYTPAPRVVSIARASPSPTEMGSSVSWTVSFDMAVTGVNAGDFALVQGGGLSGAVITGVSGSGSTWTVTATAGSGSGTLGLNLVDNDSIVASGMPLGGVGAGNGSFTGEVYAVAPPFCSPPANAPAGIELSCICDKFDRSGLNPSPIFSTNWIVSTSDSTGILPRIVNPGYLRLTERTSNNAKAATVPGIFPAAGNYISVEFQHFAYNGSGADGMAVTLSDYSVPAVPGAFGGSLGYAQKSNPGSDCTTAGGCPGFAGGWIGVAIDEFGNFQNNSEGRIGGPGQRADSVSVRASGSGMSGYNYLGGTSANLSPEVDNAASTTPSRGHYYQVIVDARNEPTSTRVAVNRDTGSGYQSLLSFPNIYTAATGLGFTQAPVPTNWQISFTGSTGGSTNIHEIGSLRICAQTVYPPSGGTANGFNAIDEAYGKPNVSPGVAIQNYLTGHIYTKLVGVPFQLNVAALDGNQVQKLYVVSGSKDVKVKLVDNSDGVCVLDSVQANYCSSACKNKSAVDGGSQTLKFTSSDKGEKRSADFTLNSAWRKLVAIVDDGTTVACSTDAFAVRPTSIVSVVSPDATNAANSGTPIFRAGSDTFSLTMTTSGVAGKAAGYTGAAKIDSAGIDPVAPALARGVFVPPQFPAAVSNAGSSTATGTKYFKYSEVGVFRLLGYDPADSAYFFKPRGVFDGVSSTECSGTPAQCDGLRGQTWTGVDSVSTAGDCVPYSFANVKDASGKYGCNFGIVSNTAYLGRFIPYEFALTRATMFNRTAACPADPPSDPSDSPLFSYLDEGIGLAFTLEARSGIGNVTKNYAGALAKLVLPNQSTISTMNFGAAAAGPPFAQLSNRLSGSAFAGAWPAADDTNAGIASITGRIAVSSLNSPTVNRVAPDGPFVNAALGIAPVDSDGVRILTYDLDTDNNAAPDRRLLQDPDKPNDSGRTGRTTLYFGMMRLLPAMGSELLPLSVQAEILRWNGSGFVPNGDDNCTVVPQARLTLNDWKKNLAAGETSITSGDLAFAAGRATLRLSAPGKGNDGGVNVVADLIGPGMAYLTGRWPERPGESDTTPTLWNDNPWTNVSFGLYKGAGRIIHFREMY